MRAKKEKTNQKWHLSEFRYDKEKGIYLPPIPHPIGYSDGVQAETYILNVIKNAEDISDDSDELMRYVKDWPSYYHLGVGRSNILKSLDISPNAKVLELGSGCGAITRYLGENFESVDGIEGSCLRAQIAHERCRDLENVRIFCSNFKNVMFDSIYDVVTLIGVLEYAPVYFADQHQTAKEACFSLLQLAKTALKPDGILIVAIENKLGLKYWSGCPEDHTGKVFDSIHGYPTQPSPVTCSKMEIEALLRKAGFSNISFYYCFPDYKFASTIISDIGDERDFYLHNWIEVPFTSYNMPRIYTFHEGLSIKTLSEAGLLREFANSFLIVASQGPPHIIRQPDWIVKKFSVKRRKEFRCVTTLKVNPKPYVEKKRLVSKDVEYNIGNNAVKIKHKINNSPWCKGDLMIFDVFRAIYEPDFKNKILEILNLYYQELISRYYTGINDKEGYPLLRGDSIDFIFRNIIKDNGKLYPIDTEWHMEDDIPADYVMYRCITIDIIGSQKPWIKKKIGDPDKFTIKLIKHFFPKYGEVRHNKNKMLEKSIQNIISNGLNPVILPQKFQFLRDNKITWTLIRSVWNKLPYSIKIKIRELAR